MEQEVMRPRIGAQEVLRAAEILRKYRRGKENLDKRIIDNEQFWKLRHWEQMEKAGEGGNPADPRPASGWLVNCILSKHADAMDSYPEPTVLPREPDDREEAAKLTRILPVILKNNRFKREYAKAWWNKLKSGCAVYGVFWDGDKLHGLGDVDIRSMDVLNLFWEPGVQDIQASEHFFSTELVPYLRLLREYPQLEGTLGRGGGAQVSRYLYDDRVDTSDQSLVVDWYYHTEVNGQPVLQYCKFVGETVLYATENDPAYAERGWYDHGKYPFVFDVLFPEEGIRTLTGEELAFSYRHSLLTDRPDAVVLRAVFALEAGESAAIREKMDELMARRKASQPLEYPSAGSTFKRPEGYFAAALIDQCGLKGLTVGGAQVSEKHAGFVINRGGATCADVLALMARVQQRVWEEKGVRLEPEFKVIHCGEKRGDTHHFGAFRQWKFPCRHFSGGYRLLYRGQSARGDDAEICQFLHGLRRAVRPGSTGIRCPGGRAVPAAHRRAGQAAPQGRCPVPYAVSGGRYAGHYQPLQGDAAQPAAVCGGHFHRGGSPARAGAAGAGAGARGLRAGHHGVFHLQAAQRAFDPVRRRRHPAGAEGQRHVLRL